MKNYKILASGHRACHRGAFVYMPGEWAPRIEDIARCRRGYHYCNENHIARWLFGNFESDLPLELWECEVDGGQYDEYDGKGVAHSIRLTRLVDTLDEYDLRWLATIFAESMLCSTDDPRVGECINTVRAYSLGFADVSELREASIAAWSAAESAVESAARSAVESAARSAAESAARSAAWSAESSAVRSAVRSAAASAARSAENAAWSAASAEVLRYIEDAMRP